MKTKKILNSKFKFQGGVGVAVGAPCQSTKLFPDRHDGFLGFLAAKIFGGKLDNFDFLKFCPVPTSTRHNLSQLNGVTCQHF